MKTILAMFILTAAGFAQAHPTDSDMLNTIGVGSELLFQQDINVPGQTPSISFKDDLANTLSDRTKCMLEVIPSEDDRVIPAQKRLTVREIVAERAGEEGWVRLRFAGNTAIKELRCIRRMYINNRIEGFNPPIGRVKGVLNQKIQILFAKPRLLL